MHGLPSCAAPVVSPNRFLTWQFYSVENYCCVHSKCGSCSEHSLECKVGRSNKSSNIHRYNSWNTVYILRADFPTSLANPVWGVFGADLPPSTVDTDAQIVPSISTQLKYLVTLVEGCLETRVQQWVRLRPDYSTVWMWLHYIIAAQKQVVKVAINSS